MAGYDPSADPEDALPPGPPHETFSQRIRRLARQLHGTPDLPDAPTPQDLARRVRMEKPFEDRMDDIFRVTPREPGEEGD